MLTDVLNYALLGIFYSIILFYIHFPRAFLVFVFATPDYVWFACSNKAVSKTDEKMPLKRHICKRLFQLFPIPNLLDYVDHLSHPGRVPLPFSLNFDGYWVLVRRPEHFVLKGLPLLVSLPLDLLDPKLLLCLCYLILIQPRKRNQLLPACGGRDASVHTYFRHFFFYFFVQKGMAYQRRNIGLGVVGPQLILVNYFHFLAHFG